MSRTKFASITSELLARKGDAKPWQPIFQPSLLSPGSEPSANLRGADVQRAEATKEIEPDHTKRYVIKLTASEYERLGIAAVKKNTSRQQIVRRALEEYLACMSREFRQGCDCLIDREARRCPEAGSASPG